LACCIHSFAGREKSAGAFGGAVSGVLFTSAGGGKAINLSEEEGGSAGDYVMVVIRTFKRNGR